MKYFNAMFLFVLFTGFNCLDVLSASKTRFLRALTNPALTRCSTLPQRSSLSEQKREQSRSSGFGKMLFGTSALAAAPVMIALSSSDEKDSLGRTIENENDNFVLPSQADIDLLKYAAVGYVEGVTGALMDGAYVNVKDEYGSTPLHYAVRNGSLSVIRILLAAKARVNEQDNRGRTPLHYHLLFFAHSKFDHSKDLSWEIVRLLLETWADVNVKDKDGNTPLYFAADNISEVMPLLLVAGAGVNEKNNDGETPLHAVILAIYKVSCSRRVVYENLQLLLKEGAHVHVQNKAGSTPLHYAAVIGDVVVVKLLFDAGASAFVDIQNCYGDTSLHNAVRGGHSAIIKLLLERGADERRTNGVGKTPAELFPLSSYRVE